MAATALCSVTISIPAGPVIMLSRRELEALEVCNGINPPSVDLPIQINDPELLMELVADYEREEREATVAASKMTIHEKPSEPWRRGRPLRTGAR